MRKGVIIGLAVVAVLVAILAVVSFVSVPSGSVDTAEDGTHTLELAMLTVPIAEPEPLIEGPNQFLGVLHAAPGFDTSEFGPDMTLYQDTSRLEPFTDDEVLRPDSQEILRAVYLGHDVHDDPYYIWQSGFSNLFDVLGQIVVDFGDFGRLETSYGSSITGDGIFDDTLEQQIPVAGLTGGFMESGLGETTLVAEWHGLPEEVAAVVIYRDGNAAGWQTPVSGSIAFRLRSSAVESDPSPPRIEFVALTRDGDEWNRRVLFTG